MNLSKWSVKDMTEIAIVIAIYIALTLTPPLNAISFGAIQFRISEMLNFLAFYHPKYILAVTIGCMISNLIGYGVVDLVVGGLSTLFFVTVGVRLFKKYRHQYLFKGRLNRAFFYFSLFFSASMFTIALELYVMYQSPFFFTWFTTGMGELISLLMGAIVIEKVARHLNWTYHP